MRSRIPAAVVCGGASDVITSRGLPRQSSVSPPLPIIDSDLDSDDIASCIDPDSIDLIVTESDSNGFWGLDETTTEFHHHTAAAPSTAVAPTAAVTTSAAVTNAAYALQLQQQQLMMLQQQTVTNGTVIVAGGLLPPELGCLAVAAGAAGSGTVRPMAIDDETPFVQERHISVSGEVRVATPRNRERAGLLMAGLICCRWLVMRCIFQLPIGAAFGTCLSVYRGVIIF